MKLGSAMMQNLWPRPGMDAPGVRGRSCIGRFAAGPTDWVWDNAVTGTRVSGTGDPLEWVARWHRETLRHFPHAGMMGYVAYEMGYPWLNLSPPAEHPDSTWNYPLVQFLIFEELERLEDTAPGFACHTAKSYDPARLDRLIGRTSIRSLTDRQTYIEDVERIKRHIAAGDIYQANYTQGFDLSTFLTPDEIFARLARENSAPYAVNLQFAPVTFAPAAGLPRSCPGISVIAVSPERFWQKRGRFVETRPIKGTAPRSADPDQDRANLRDLLASAKNRAELLMITDLARNDIGKIAETGTVQTTALRRPHAARSVWHLESTVSAQARPDVDWTAIMRATFPGGSITGAPKRRAVEIIRDLEPCPRGVYCGAIGWVDSHGDAEFALGIRTAVQIGSQVRVFGGGGIVADSEPIAEYYESLVKIAPMLDALSHDDAIQSRQPSHEDANTVGA